jgi:hypothetical protein
MANVTGQEGSERRELVSVGKDLFVFVLKRLDLLDCLLFPLLPLALILDLLSASGILKVLC